MKTRYAFYLLSTALILISVTSCRKKPVDITPPAGSTTGELAKAPPEDTAYKNGQVLAATIEMHTKVDVPGLIPEGTMSEELKKAIEKSTTKQVLTVSEDRGKITFATEDFLVPLGSELRYQPAQKKYVLTEPQKKIFWVMSGAEIGNLLEGGPQIKREGYSLKITDTAEKEQIAGYETVRTNAELGFAWSSKTKDSERKGKVQVLLSIWHSADAKFKPAWGELMVDLLSVPFQDEEGRKIVDQIKGRVKFPLKWSMEMREVGGRGKRGDLPPKLITTARQVQIAEVERLALAYPPLGASSATTPYEFGQDGQTVPAEVLSQIPAQPGQPPQ